MTKTLPLKWVYKYKTDSNGFIQRFKARLCARGDLQATTHDTYASTLALKVFRLMCAIVAHFDLEMEQMDAVNAYLNAELPRPIHLQSPPGIETPEGSRLLLLRALYGLKESGFLWQQKLRHTLEDLGLKQVPGVECLYTDGFLTFFFYIDDMALIYARRHLDRAEHFKTELRKAFEIKFLGNLTWYLGIKVTRDRSTRSLWLSQEAYINKIVSTFEVHLTARKTRSPLPSNLTLCDVRRHMTWPWARAPTPGYISGEDLVLFLFLSFSLHLRIAGIEPLYRRTTSLLRSGP